MFGIFCSVFPERVFDGFYSMQQVGFLFFLREIRGFMGGIFAIPFSGRIELLGVGVRQWIVGSWSTGLQKCTGGPPEGRPVFSATNFIITEIFSRASFRASGGRILPPRGEKGLVRIFKDRY
jgi:hypothetical protein